MSTPDFFRSRLEAMIDLRHPLAVLSTRMPWAAIEASLAPFFERKPGKPRTACDADLFGEVCQVGGVTSAAGRPRLPIRLMAALLYLKHAYNESDESVVERWSQDVYYQFFSGNEFFEPRLPCDATQIGRFRRALGEAGVEQLLKTTIEAAVQLKAVRTAELQHIIVDSTVQEKAVAHPTDSRLMDVARRKIVQLAKREGLVLKQTFDRECKVLRRKAGGHAHARQFKRLRRVVKRQRTILGVVLREVRRKLSALGEAAANKLSPWLDRAERIHRQRPSDKNKLYALHAPEVECISKGKSRRPYEFGVKVSLAVTHKQGLVVGARSFPGNPYDGHTLREQVEQTSTLLQDIGVKPSTVFTDLGYRGVDAELNPVQLVHRGKWKSLTTRQRNWLQRRQAIEPTIGHLKQDHGMQRCWLKGSEGDALNAVLCAAGFNIRWLMRAILRIGLRALLLRLKFIALLLGATSSRTHYPVPVLAPLMLR